MKKSTGSLADAAAAAFGALSLPSSEAVDLIIKNRVPGVRVAPSGDAPLDDVDAASGDAADEPKKGPAEAKDSDV